MTLLIGMVSVDRDWINLGVMNDVLLVIYWSLTFSTDMNGRSLLAEA